MGGPAAGFAITAFICHVGYEVTTGMLARLMDGLDPGDLDAESAAAAVPGIRPATVRAPLDGPDPAGHGNPPRRITAAGARGPDWPPGRRRRRPRPSLRPAVLHWDARACTPAAPPGEIRQLYLIELLTGTHPSFPSPPVKCAGALLERTSRMNGIVLRLTRPLVSQACRALCP